MRAWAWTVTRKHVIVHGMKKCIFLIFFFVAQVQALTLKEKLRNGQVGDFIVTEQNKTLSLLRIHSIDDKRITLEEVSLPTESGLKGKDRWEEWIMRGAPGHTSWTMFEIDLEGSNILNCYSFSKQAWLVGFADESVFLKLLSCPLKPIPFDQLRKIGPPPMDGPDLRKVWTPPLIVDGKEQKTAPFQPYKITCPDGDYPLSGKRLEIYFTKKDGDFPFPHWARVTDDSNASFKIRVYDSGRNLHSPFKGIPKLPSKERL